MVGYSVGITGTTSILGRLLTLQGGLAIAVSYAVLVVGVCIMRYIRTVREAYGDDSDMAHVRHVSVGSYIYSYRHWMRPAAGANGKDKFVKQE